MDNAQKTSPSADPEAELLLVRRSDENLAQFDAERITEALVREAKRLRGLWWGLLALVVLPYFVLPRLLGWLEGAGQPGPQFVVGLLSNALLFLGQVALFGTALPGLGLMAAAEFLTAPLHRAGPGWPLPLAWASWGLGLGLVLGLRSWLRSSHLPRWGNALVLGYLGVWTAASLWLMR